MPAMITFAFADALNTIGSDRLRACPLIASDGAPCDAIFLGHLRQIYCTPRHGRPNVAPKTEDGVEEAARGEGAVDGGPGSEG